MIVKQKSNRIASDCTWQRNTDHTLLPIVQQTNEQNGVRHKHKWLLHHNEISNAFNKDWWHIFVLESTLEFQLPESWACEEFDSTTAWKQFEWRCCWMTRSQRAVGSQIQILSWFDPHLFKRVWTAFPMQQTFLQSEKIESLRCWSTGSRLSIHCPILFWLPSTHLTDVAGPLTKGPVPLFVPFLCLLHWDVGLPTHVTCAFFLWAVQSLKLLSHISASAQDSNTQPSIFTFIAQLFKPEIATHIATMQHHGKAIALECWSLGSHVAMLEESDAICLWVHVKKVLEDHWPVLWIVCTSHLASFMAHGSSCSWWMAADKGVMEAMLNQA